MTSTDAGMPSASERPTTSRTRRSRSHSLPDIQGPYAQIGMVRRVPRSAV